MRQFKRNGGNSFSQFINSYNVSTTSPKGEAAVGFGDPPSALPKKIKRLLGKQRNALPSYHCHAVGKDIVFSQKKVTTAPLVIY